jgi:hypothetical protein
MDRASILQALKQERDRLSAAIAALEGGSTGNAGKRGDRKGITPEGRRRLSEAMKKRWAARRAAKKK